MVGVEGVSKVWLRGSWLQLEFETHRCGKDAKKVLKIVLNTDEMHFYRFAALARRQLVPGSARLWGRVEVCLK